MTNSPADRVRRRLNELGVGPMPTNAGGELHDHSPDVIRVSDLAEGDVLLEDRLGNSWSGLETAALEALDDLEAGLEPGAVWERLVRS